MLLSCVQPVVNTASFGLAIITIIRMIIKAMMMGRRVV